MGANRLQEHLNFIVSNLSYEHIGGRKAILDLIGSLIHSFPEELLSNHCEFFFVPVALRLLKEEEYDFLDRLPYTAKTHTYGLATYREIDA